MLALGAGDYHLGALLGGLLYAAQGTGAVAQARGAVAQAQGPVAQGAVAQGMIQRSCRS